MRDCGTLRTEVSRGGSVGVSHFLLLRFGAELAGFWIKFPEPYRASFTLSREFAFEAGLRLGLDAPPRDIIVIERHAGHFFLVLIEIDQS